jgi:hypothetical protein
MSVTNIELDISPLYPWLAVFAVALLIGLVIGVWRELKRDRTEDTGRGFWGVMERLLYAGVSFVVGFFVMYISAWGKMTAILSTAMASSELVHPNLMSDVIFPVMIGTPGFFFLALGTNFLGRILAMPFSRKRS